MMSYEVAPLDDVHARLTIGCFGVALASHEPVPLRTGADGGRRPPPRRRPRPAPPPPRGRPYGLPQHERKNPAVLVVVDFNRRIDAHANRHFARLAVAMNAQRRSLLRTKCIINTADVE